MSIAAAILLAASPAQPVPADGHRALGLGAEVETARVAVTIVRSVMLKDGALVSLDQRPAPHSQRQSHDGRVTYEFE